MQGSHLSESHSVPPVRGKHFFALGLCLLVALVSRMSFLGEPFEHDAGLYILMGRTLYEGGVPYVDFWETKLPGVAIVTAPLYALFGGNWLGYVMFYAAVGVFGPFVLARAAGRYAGEHTYWPTLLFLLVGFNLTRIVISGLQLETTQAFIAILAAAVGLRALALSETSSLFVAGLLGGAAAFGKPTGLAVSGALGLALLVQARQVGTIRTLSRLVCLIAGVSLPLGGVAMWVLLSPMRAEVPHLAEQIFLYGSGTPWEELFRPKKLAVFAFLVFFPFGIRIMLSLGQKRGGMAWPSRCVLWFAAAWLVAEVVGVLFQRRLHSSHYLVVVPPAALLFGMLPLSTTLWRVQLSVAPLAAVSLAFAVPKYLTTGSLRTLPSSQYIIQHTEEEDRIWADPSPRILLETGRQPGARLGYTLYFANHDNAPAQFLDVLLRDFEEREPKYLLMHWNWRNERLAMARSYSVLRDNPVRIDRFVTALDQLQAYIDAHYVNEAEVDGTVIYRRIP